MSMKIYNGYILKDQLSMYKIYKFVDGLREKATLEGRKRIQNMVIKDFLYFYYWSITETPSTVYAMPAMLMYMRCCRRKSRNA